MQRRSSSPVDGAGFIDDRLLAQLIERAASPDFDRWWARVVDSGFCAAPIHLSGTGNAGQQTRVLTRCKNRRAAVCPSCSRLYAGDTWQLVHRGLTDEARTSRVKVFATLTAPGFGAVHRIGKCHPTQHGRCSHDHPIGCAMVHLADDPLLGTPLCSDCYDYAGHVLFTWHAPQLWHRFTITLRRGLRHRLRDHDCDPVAVRLSYVKIVELQRRGIPHYHAVIRLDPTNAAAIPLTSTDLAALVIQAARAARLRVAGSGAGLTTVRFGEQIDTQPLDVGTETSRAVAGYLAKYVTKSVADLGLSHRRITPQAIDRLDLDQHVRRILHTLVALADYPDRRDMLRWLHTLGYRGHVTSKTRHYSTTMTALRAQRAAWRADRHGDDRSTAGDENRVWEYAGNGHTTEGDRLLVVSAARRAIEQQQVARDCLRAEREHVHAPH